MARPDLFDYEDCIATGQRVEVCDHEREQRARRIEQYDEYLRQQTATQPAETR